MTRYRAFLKAVETGSVTRTAEELGYTQAAVSQMIRSLETELGIPLLTRTRRGVSLTAEGRKIYPRVQKIVLSRRELEDAAAEINGLYTGEIRIGTFSSVSQRVLPQLIKSFNDVYPNINFVLMQGNNTTIPDWIRSGAVDFGFAYPGAAAGLEKKDLFSENYVAVLPKGHPLAGEPEVPLTRLAKEPLILSDEGAENAVAAAFERNGIRLRPKYRIEDDPTIFSMIEAGLGVGILSSLLLHHTRYDVKQVRTAEKVGRTVCVAYPGKDMLSTAAKRFIDFIFENIKNVLGGEEFVTFQEVLN